MVKGLLRAKHGWIRIVEAFVAILLITGTLLVFLDSGQHVEQDFSPEVYALQDAVLLFIQTNDTLRGELFSQTLPKNWSDLSSLKTGETITSKTSRALSCEATLCAVDSLCLSKIQTQESVYARSIALFSYQTSFSPRQLTLFCTTK